MFDPAAGRDADLLYQSEQVKERNFFRWQKRASARAGREISTAEFAAMTTEERREAAGVTDKDRPQFGESLGIEADLKIASLLDRFVVPPFSVLDTRQGYWQTRRREWLALGIKGELGRGEDLQKSGAGSVYNGRSEWAAPVAPAGWKGANSFSPQSVALSGGWDNHPGAVHAGPAVAVKAQDALNAIMGSESMGTGTSIFDPVLCELAYRWWCPEGGTVLDPFAGGSVRGIVASRLGHPYIGIDLSERQLAANRAQAAEVCEEVHPPPEWLHGDARTVLAGDGVSHGVDLVFTCPPYGDLEVYSDDPADLSAMRWPEFVEAYEAIIRLACERLTVGRFAVIVVSEIRGPDGAYRGLIPVTIEAFLRAGLRYYNECILVNSIGSLPIRIGRQFEAGRKIGCTHQNVLVFAKGDPERGWSYERAAPPDPQLSMFSDLALPQPLHCSDCGKAVPAGPIVNGNGQCYVCDSVTVWVPG